MEDENVNVEIDLDTPVEYIVGDVVMVHHELQDVVVVRITEVKDNDTYVGDPIMKQKTVKDIFQFTREDIFNLKEMSSEKESKLFNIMNK